MPASSRASSTRPQVCEHVDVLGIGTSLTCYGAIVPTAENLGQLVALAEGAERQLGRKLLVSGGMSTSLDAFAVRRAARGDRQPADRRGHRARREPCDAENPSSGCTPTRWRSRRRSSSARSSRRCRSVSRRKTPSGDGRISRTGASAAGRSARSAVRTSPPAALQPLDPRVEVLGASSDHLILDVDDLPEPPRSASRSRSCRATRRRSRCSRRRTWRSSSSARTQVCAPWSLLSVLRRSSPRARLPLRARAERRGARSSRRGRRSLHRSR